MLAVGRKADRRMNSRLAARAATLSKPSHGDHRTRAWPTGSMPRRPARPVSWVYSPAVSASWWSPVNFDRDSITTERAGMLMPRASVSVANTTFTRPWAKQASTASLNGGTIPAWWAATPDSRAASQRSWPSTTRSSAPRRARCASAMARMRTRSSAVVRWSPSSCTERTASSQPLRLKMKQMAGRSPLPSRWATTSVRRGVPHLWRARCWWRRCRGPWSCGASKRWPSGFGRPSTSVWSWTRRWAALSWIRKWFTSSTGRSCSTTVVVGPRAAVIHPASSSALDTVADRQTNRTACGVCTMTSSQTGPR